MNFLQDRRVVLALGTLAIASLVWNVVLPLVQERGSGSSVADVVVDAGVTEMPQQSVPGNPLASTAGTGSPHAERFGVLDTTAPAGRDPAGACAEGNEIEIVGGHADSPVNCS